MPLSESNTGRLIGEAFKYGIGAVIALWLTYVLTQSVVGRLVRMEATLATAVTAAKETTERLERLVLWQRRQTEIAFANCLNNADGRAEAAARCQAEK